MTWEGRTELRPGFDMTQVGDVVVPRTIAMMSTGADGDPDLVMQFEVRDGKPECTRITIDTKPNGRGIRSGDIATFNIDGITASIFSKFAMPVGDGDPESALPAFARSSRAELEKVAEVYREHVTGNPTEAVRLRRGYNSHRTAARRVQQARDAGLLPPTEPGKKKA